MLDKRLCGLAAVAGVVALLKSGVVATLTGGIVPTDFRSFYFASLGVVRGGSIYDRDYVGGLASALGTPGYVFPYLYPPPLAYYLTPLTALGVKGACCAWQILSVALTAVVLIQSIRLALSLRDTAEPRDCALLPLLAVFLMLVLPFDNNLAMGQVNVLVLALVATSLVQAVGSRRDLLAGFLLAPAVLIKVTPVILLPYYLLNRRYRAAYGFIGGLALFALPTLISSGGLRTWQEFVAFTRSMSYGKTVPGLFPAASLPNFSVAGCVARLAPTESATNLATWIVLALLGLALIAWHRRQASRGEGDSLILAYLALMVVAAPFAYLHHVVYIYPGLLAAAWLLLTDATRLSRWLLVAGLALAIAASLDLPLMYDRLGIRWSAARSLNLCALLGLFAIGWLAGRAGRTGSVASPTR